MAWRLPYAEPLAQGVEFSIESVADCVYAFDQGRAKRADAISQRVDLAVESRDHSIYSRVRRADAVVLAVESPIDGVVLVPR